MTDPNEAKRIAKNAGLSLTPDLIDKLDALRPRAGRRSEFVRELLFDGLVKRFGPDWERIADEKKAEAA